MQTKHQYMPQLDGLRAIAVFGVLITHYLPQDHMVRMIAPWGAMGVQLFFTLSGFLITGILLRCRGYVEHSDQTLGFTLKRFYIRRTLRIFPLFYLIIAATAALNIGEVRENILWHVFYLSNVGMSLEGRGFGDSTHFWSLAVEEQFYLLWPLVALTIPRRWMVPAILALICVGPVSRLGISLTDMPWVARSWLPVTCFDSLLAGALLAVFYSDDAWLRHKKRLTQIGFWVGVPASIVLIAGRHWDPIGSAADLLLGRTAQALAAIWLIDKAASGFSGTVGKLLCNRVLIYIGSISYGIYVIHNFVPDLIAPLGIDNGTPLGLRFVLWSVATIALASISWHLFEKPINACKDRYPYKNEKLNSEAS